MTTARQDPVRLEGVEEQPHGGLHLGVGVQDDAVLNVMNEADRDHLLELAAAGAAQDTAAQARLEHMQFRLAHGAFQAQEQAVVEVRRIIQPVLIQDERIGQSAQLEQAMPVGGVARQARYFKAEHDPDSTETDFGHEALEALAVSATGAGLSEVAVDHNDPIERPTERTAHGHVGHIGAVYSRCSRRPGAASTGERTDTPGARDAPP